jgi:exodeoxyribonuclease VII large subunit
LVLSKSILEDSFDSVWVNGEVTNFRPAASGHWYFSLKDAQAELKVAMFRSRNLYCKVKPENGSKLNIRGRLTVYEARGELQLIAEQIEDAGLGVELQALEALKAKLAAEGLFATERKRRVPLMSRRIALITSPTGAAVQDFLQVCARRFPMLAIEIWPCLVQGSEAALQITQALQAIAVHRQRYDLIVITRGGGSAQDLSCFNDEALVRAVAASPIPVVSAVGHEVDTTLCDFAADLRAPTPSAAAELITPDQAALQQRLGAELRKLQLALRRKLEPLQFRVDQMQRRLDAQSPQRRVLQTMDRLQRAHLALQRAMHRKFDQLRQTQRHQANRLQALNPGALIQRAQRSVLQQRTQLQRAMQLRLAQSVQRLAHADAALRTLSPERTLERGYAIVYDQQGKVQSSLAAISAPALRIRLHDGSMQVQVTSTSPTTTAAKDASDD